MIRHLLSKPVDFYLHIILHIPRKALKMVSNTFQFYIKSLNFFLDTKNPHKTWCLYGLKAILYSMIERQTIKESTAPPIRFPSFLLHFNVHKMIIFISAVNSSSLFIFYLVSIYILLLSLLIFPLFSDRI